MKNTLITLCALLLLSPAIARQALASQADDTTISITAQTPGVTPFISQLTLQASDTSVLKSIQFTIGPKDGSVTRALSGTYAATYLVERGYLDSGSGQIFLPVYGLYAGATNTVTLVYHFNDGSSKQDSTTILTDSFVHPCGLDSPTVLQARTDDTSLSYDYMLIKGGCSSFEPVIMDSDGSLRWASPAGFSVLPSAFYDNAVYQTAETSLYRVDLDGTITLLHDYSDIGASFLHHNIDLGKFGLILDVDTNVPTDSNPDLLESVNYEVDAAGNILKQWDLAQIISDAMIAGGDDPNEFVFPAPDDWFHNNAVTYNRADDSVLISSRENFVICLDYESNAIKWILGDTTKKWHQFPSLARYALTLPPGSAPPIGQHALSITFDQNLLLFDNGFASLFQQPVGIQRGFASGRKYRLDLQEMTATEVWNFEMDQSIVSPICGSIYEDAPYNYVLDYAFVGGFSATTPYAQILGLNAADETVFYYQYPTVFCNTAYNATPLHLESTTFPTIHPRPLNLSTRGLVGMDQQSLIGGFIISGNDDHKVLMRALGPSLTGSGLSQVVSDPVLSLYDASGTLVAMNDNWESDSAADEIAANGLAPEDAAEAATVQTLSPGAYTFVVAGSDTMPGVGLVEAYDLSPAADSKLANLSARGFVGTDDQLLISGFIVGEVDSDTVIIRALGPSLAGSGITGPLSDPTLTVYDHNGTALISNDSWQDDVSASDLTARELAPDDPAEAATILHLPAGAYTAIVSGADGTTGVGLAEIYDLEP